MLYAIGSLILHFMLGDPVSAKGRARRSAASRVALNLILAFPVFALCRRLFVAGRAGSTRWSSLASTGARLRPGRFLLDPRAKTPYRLTPQMVFRIGILGFLVIVAFAISSSACGRCRSCPGAAPPGRREQPAPHGADRGCTRPIRDWRGRGRRQRRRNRRSASALRTCPTTGLRRLKRLARILRVPLRDIASRSRSTRAPQAHRSP